MKEHFTTLKIKYIPENGDSSLILSYMKNYNNVLRFTYNRIQEGITSSVEPNRLQKQMNNIFIGSHFRASAIYEAKSLSNPSVIFGGKNLYLQRCHQQITAEEYRLKRLLPLYSVGDINKKGNRKFQIIDEKTILFKPSKNEHLNLHLINIGKKYQKTIKQLLRIQEEKIAPITYRLDLNYIYISFDNTKIESHSYKTISNRVIAIDMNPNYLGYAVVDWKDEKYKIIDKGVFDLSLLTTQENTLHVKSNHPKAVYIRHKRNYELIQIAYFLFKLCKHFQCGYFVIEDLSIKKQNFHKGKTINRLINNQWNRQIFLNTLIKLIESSSTNLIKIQPQYSSVLGNLIYREEHLPDMVLSSIELSRRGYEFACQYLLNKKSKEKTIIFPNLELVKTRIIQSLEELNNSFQFGNYQELFSGLKKSKVKYRFLLGNCQNSRVFSKFYYKSYIKFYQFI